MKYKTHISINSVYPEDRKDWEEIAQEEELTKAQLFTKMVNLYKEHRRKRIKKGD